MINGGVIGLIYILLIYFLSSFIGSSFSLNMYSMIMIGIGVISGMLGGIVRSKYGKIILSCNSQSE